MHGAKLGENIAREWREESHAPQLWDALQLVKADHLAGIVVLEQLAKNGSRLAKMYLGDVLLSGKHGVPEDRSAGEYWLRCSAEEGSIEGRYGLAWLLRNTGRTEAALTEYARLADLGYAPALYALGAHHYRGAETERDLPKALDYFLRGEALGHFYSAIWACRILMRSETGLSARFRGFTKMLALLVPSARTVWNYPNSDRLRV